MTMKLTYSLPMLLLVALTGFGLCSCEEEGGHGQPEAPAHQALDQVGKEGDELALAAEIADNHENAQGQQDPAPESVVGTGRLLDLLLGRFGPGVLLGRGALAGGRAAPGSGLSGAGF